MPVGGGFVAQLGHHFMQLVGKGRMGGLRYVVTAVKGIGLDRVHAQEMKVGNGIAKQRTGKLKRMARGVGKIGEQQNLFHNTRGLWSGQRPGSDKVDSPARPHS